MPLAEASLVTLAQIREAELRISSYVPVTPLVSMTSRSIWLKAESLHITGAFKLRGAFNSILSLSERQRQRGVVAYSSGNHAQAVAHAAHQLGVNATLVMPHTTPRFKIDATRRWGARVLIDGHSSEELAQIAARIVEQQGLELIHPFDSVATIAATGSVGLEILRQAPGVELITVPIGGGGLIAGLAAAIKLTHPAVRIVGVEPELSSDAYESFKSGEIVTISADTAGRTIADGLRLQRLGALNWAHVRAFVDDIITVTENEIAEAVRDISTDARLVAEPSGAVAAAGLRKLPRSAAGRAAPPAVRAIAILSGGNIDCASYAALLSAATA